MESKVVVTLGEVLMRLSVSADMRLMQAGQMNVHYGGSEANVAVALAQWGVSARHVSRFPEHDLGLAAKRALQQAGVDVGFCLTGSGRMPLYFLEPGVGERSGRIIYDRFDSAFAGIQPGSVNWPDVLQDASWFHWSGITPAISQGALDVCSEALSCLPGSGVWVSADINYRRNLWAYGKSAGEVMPDLLRHTDFWIAGPEDLKNCLHIVAGTFEEGCSQASKMFPRLKGVAFIQRDVISASHNYIQGMWWNGKEIISSRVMEISPIADRIGAGDAFAAGMIYGKLHQWDDQRMIDFATAACALKHTVAGDVLLAALQEVLDLTERNNVGKLLR